jgi:FKBP-type peptidyl-prolyl cis-trans isomerase FkpA
MPRIRKPEKQTVGNVLRRSGWLLLVILFVVTSLGVGVAAFWQATHQPKDNSAQTTPPPPPSSNTPKLAGTKLSGFTPVNKVDSLQKIDTKPGTGTTASANSTVTVHYTGAVAATGVIFQSSLDSGQPVSFALKQVIKGWSEGVPGMKVGGERRLLIPAAEAYGANPPQGSNIPPNADLVFDIVLLNVK